MQEKRIKTNYKDLNKHWFSIYVGYTLHYPLLWISHMWFMRIFNVYLDEEKNNQKRMEKNPSLLQEFANDSVKCSSRYLVSLSFGISFVWYAWPNNHKQIQQNSNAIAFIRREVKVYVNITPLLSAFGVNKPIYHDFNLIANFLGVFLCLSLSIAVFFWFSRFSFVVLCLFAYRVPLLILFLFQPNTKRSICNFFSYNDATMVADKQFYTIVSAPNKQNAMWK